MKKISNFVCVVLIIIGAIIATVYANYEKPNELKEQYEHGQYVVDENGNGSYIQYYDFGQTQKQAKEQKILAFTGFIVYTFVIIGVRFFIELRHKTKAEIKNLEKSKGEDFLL